MEERLRRVLRERVEEYLAGAERLLGSPTPLDGWEVLRELKSMPETQSIPVIVASITDDRQLAFGLGAVEHFVKPVDRARLIEAVRKYGASGHTSIVYRSERGKA